MVADVSIKTNVNSQVCLFLQRDLQALSTDRRIPLSPNYYRSAKGSNFWGVKSYGLLSRAKSWGSSCSLCSPCSNAHECEKNLFKCKVRNKMRILRRIFLFLGLPCLTATTDSSLTGLINCQWQTSEFV